jgi:methylmalonyl-CoA mutase cobalamin-binding domain/chain
MKEHLQAIATEFSRFKYFETEDKIRRALEAGVPRSEVMNTLLASFHRALEKYEKGEYSIAHLTAAASIFEMGLELVKVEMVPKAKVVIGTLGSSHYLGKDIIGLLLAADGFEVVDLGEIVFPEQVIEAVVREKPDILALSALIIACLPLQRMTIQLLEAQGLREEVKVMIGGAVTSERWAKEIGADAWAPDGPGAIREANRLIA